MTFWRLNQILSVLLLLLTSGGYSQINEGGYDVLFGRPVSISSREFQEDVFVHQSQTYGVTVRQSSKPKLVIYSFDEQYKNIGRGETELIFNGETHKYVGNVVLGDTVVIFTSLTNRRTRVTQLFKHYVNLKNLTLYNTRNIFEMEYTDGPKSEDVRFQFTTSPNGKYILFLSRIPSYRLEKNHFGILVYDQNLNLKWSKPYTGIGGDAENFLEFRIDISNQGEVFVVSKMINDNWNSRSNELPYRYRFLKYSNGKDEPISRELILKDKLIMDAEFTILDSNTVQLIGYYSTEGKGNKGVFHWKVGVDSALDSDPELTEFPIDFVTQYSSDREYAKAVKKDKNGKEVVFTGVELRQLINHSDSTYTLIGEEYRFYASQFTSLSGQMSYTYHYVYGNIVMARFNADGQVRWLEQIPKDQQTMNDEGMYSGIFVMGIQDNSIAILFNDHPKNNYLSPGREVVTWNSVTKMSDLILYIIDEEGRFSRSLIFNGLNESVKAVPRQALSLKTDEIIIVGSETKLFKLISIRFDTSF